MIILCDSCAPCSFSISTRKAKPVRKLVSQHTAVVCLSYEALIFFPTLWYRVTGILTKTFTESKGVTAAKQQSTTTTKSIVFLQDLFVRKFKFSETTERKNTKNTFFFKLFKIKKERTMHALHKTFFQKSLNISL